MRVTGHISVVQEQRFHLITEDGRGLLLTLASGAPQTDAELRQFQQSRERVTVEFTGEPGLASAVAHSISTAPARR